MIGHIRPTSRISRTSSHATAAVHWLLFALAIQMLLAPWSAVSRAPAEPILQRSDESGELAKDSSSEVSTKAFRRIFVPAENVEAWPTNGEKFLPFESPEFESWIAAANADNRDEASNVIITEAEYSARLEDGKLVGGRGRWNLKLQGNAGGFILLPNISLVLRTAQWKDTPIRPVRLGTWGRSGRPAAELALEVPESGTLEFDWSVPTTAIRGGIEAPWRLPSAAISRLILDLPSGIQPRVDGGVVLDSGSDSANESSAARRRWVIACAATNDAKLSIVDSRRPSIVAPPEMALRDETTYAITQRGLDVQTDLRVTRIGPVTTQDLNVPLPRGMQINEVLVDGHEVSWRVADDGARSFITVRLPTNDGSGERKVSIRGTQSLAHGKIQRLPKLRPDGMLWTSGEAVLHVSNDLELIELQPSRCRVADSQNVSSEKNAKDQETWLLETYSGDAEIDVAVAFRIPQPRLRLASSMSIAGADVAGQLIVECTTSSGVHKLSGKVAPGWIVEAVETTPAEAIGDWFINRRNGVDEIDVQLARPVNSEQGVTVTVRGRLPRSAFTDSISAATLRMVGWQGASIDEHVLHFESSEPLTVERTGKMPRAVLGGNNNRPPLIQSTPATGAVFDLLKADANAALRLTTKPPIYNADLLIDVGAVNGQIQSKYRIAVAPKSGSVAQILVFAAGELGDSTRWTLANSDAELSASRLPKDDPRVTAIAAIGELWLVRLPVPSNQSVEIVATSSLNAPNDDRVPLIAIPNATEQRGSILIRSDTESISPIDHEGLTAIPLPPAGIDSEPGSPAPPPRAAFRFSPVDCLNAANAPTFMLGPGNSANLSSLVVSQVAVESYYARDGCASHRAVFHLFSRSDASFEVQLAANARLQSIDVGGVAAKISPTTSTDRERTINVLIPRGACEVSLAFQTQYSTLAIGDTLEPPLPKTNATVLSGEWNLLLPEEFSVSSVDSASWRQRLFGPLGRPDGTPPFRPLRVADWANLINSSLGLKQSDELASAAPIGWLAHQQTFVAGLPFAVTVSHPPIAIAWAACVFTICVFLGAWLRRRSMRLFLALISIGALVALLAPTFLLPLPAGVLLGLIASILVPKRNYLPTEVGASTHWHRFSTVGAVLLLVLCCFASGVFGQTEAGSTDSRRATIERVLIPVGTEGQQVGSKVYISERFARDLIRETSNRSNGAGQWLLTNLECRGELRHDAAGQDTVLSQFEIVCDLETLARDTVIVLPLLRDEANWPTSALLDGVPSPIEWSTDGNFCSIRVPNPGRYTLVINAEPRIRIVKGRNLASVTIPAHPGSTLSLNRPVGLEGVTVDDAIAVQDSADGNAAMYELRAPGRVQISWPIASDSRESVQSRRPIQLEWLELTEDQVILTTKYIFEGNSEKDEEVVVALDSEWELPKNDPSYRQSKDVETNRTILRIPLPKGDAGRQELAMRCRSSKSAELGRLLLKPIELVSHQPVQSWRAVSAGTSLDVAFGDSSAGSGTVAEFLTLWGASEDAKPQSVLGNVAPLDQWNLTISPHQTDTEFNHVLHLAATVGKFDVVYQADVTPGNAERFQYRVTIPDELIVGKIELVRDGKIVPFRWTRSAKDRINLFFKNEMAGAYRVLVHGSLALDGESNGVPRIASVGSTGVSTLQIYRDSSVVLSLTGLPQNNDAISVPLESPPASWTARYVGGYRLSTAQLENVRLKVQPNDVELNGESVTSLVRSSEGWIARYECNLSVAKGTLDALYYRADSVWGTTPTLECSVPATLSVATDEDGSPQLVVRFADALPQGTSLTFRFEAPIATASGAVSMPRIRSGLPIHGTHYLRVPTLVDAQPVAWTLNAVQPAVLPASFRTFPSQRVDVRTFAATGDDFQIQMRRRLGSPKPPRVRLADTEISSDPLTGQIIRTVFVIEPQGLHDCTVRLPDGQRLVEVQIDGRPALVRHIGDNDWDVVLGPTQLSRRLEVLSRSAEKPVDSRQTVIARAILLAGTSPISVEMSLWSVGYPNSSPKPSIGVAESTAGELASLRFDRMLSIVESTTAVAIESPAPDGNHWYQQWASVLGTLRDETRNTLAHQGRQQGLSQVTRPDDDQITASSRRLDAWIARCEEALPAREPISSLIAPEAQKASESLAAILPTQQRVYCITDGSLDRLDVEYATTGSGSKQSQLIGVALVVCLAVSASVAMKYPAVGDLLHRWPHAITFLGGIAYWAWLQPSFLGLLIAGASVFFACRPGWPGRAIRTDASTVLRTGRPR